MLNVSRRLLFLCLICSLAFVSRAQTTPEVGGDSPSDFVASRFSAAFGRNLFYTRVFQTPVANVQKLGTLGLVQLFYDPTKTSNVRLALIKADANAAVVVDSSGSVVSGDVYQVYSTMWAYLASANGTSATAPSTLNTTGYPTMDTAACTPVEDSTCLYQTFDKKYVLFVYSKPLSASAGATFVLREPFYTVWTTAGGLAGLGPVVFGELAVTSPVSAAAATWQRYQNGCIISITSGVQINRVLTVRKPVYDLYAFNGGPTGFLGYPTGEARSLANGMWRQTFEGGTIDYDAAGQASLVLPVSEVNVPGSGVPLRLKLGDSYTLKARLYAPNGSELTDRTVAWTTSNSKIVAVDGQGASVTLRAVGGGVATVYAVSEGKSSPAITVYVSSPCCQAGEGAPQASVAQAIVDAINRNKLQVRIPTAKPVQRVGPGYVQSFSDAVSADRYLIAVPDGVSTGYLLRGGILTGYEALGGTAGPLGFPSMDATPGGRQLFLNRSALAGNPVRLVQGSTLDKWAVLGYEAGVLGSPASDSAAFVTFTATAGTVQAFNSGAILSGTAGTLAGRSYYLSGPLYAQYFVLNGPSGDLGMPINDEVVIDGVRHQDFEGGLMELAPGETEVRVTLQARTPAITATPNPVTAGGRVRLAAGGFPSGSQLHITVTGQPSFDVSAAQGAFAWESAVASSAASSTVVVRAVAASGESAEGSFRIRSLTDAEPKLSKAAGDAQTGVPGALLPERLRVVLRDSSGSPIPGVPVTFQPSPGASIESADLQTDVRGQASALLRLPIGEGVALATASAARLVVTFQARSAPLVLTNFPRLRQNLQTPLGRGSATIAERGALLASLANIVRYHQDRGELPLANGPADVATLNNYLTGLCIPLVSGSGASICDGFLQSNSSGEQLVNLFRVPMFVGGAADLEVGEPTLETIRDWLSAGSPVLVSLRMTANGAPAGMHHVVATGVAANGGIVSFDPGDFFGQNSVNALLSEFSAGGRTWSGALASVARLVLKPAPTAGFFVTAGEAFSVVSPAGPCPLSFRWLDRAATQSSASDHDYQLSACDGAASQYQLTPASGMGALLTVTSTTIPASRGDAAGAAVYRVAGAPEWRTQPQTLELSLTLPPLNAANSLPEIGPGSLVTVAGAGLSAAGAEAAIDLSGTPLPVVQASPFRLSFQVPPDFTPGEHILSVTSPLGAAQLTVTVLPFAPAIFEVSALPVLRREDDSAVTVDNPARRGKLLKIYATGLGPLDGANTVAPLEVEFDGFAAVPSSVASVPELPGVYRVQVTVPNATAPSSNVQLLLRQAGWPSKSVIVPVE
ncbi:MAG: hypothetical protein HY821_17320 [Acidobacteria bacterium]|nr:hypothetical protein [Acidobacteriota bacterium]